MGGVFDGSYVWLAPYMAYQLVRIDPATGTMKGYAGWPIGLTNLGSFAFRGAVFDGTNIWLVPNNANQVVRVDPLTGTMKGFVPLGGSGFSGGVFDGSSIWLKVHR